MSSFLEKLESLIYADLTKDLKKESAVLSEKEIKSLVDFKMEMLAEKLFKMFKDDLYGC